MKYAIEQYNRSINLMIEEFIKIYYTDEEGYPSEWYIIGEWWRLAPDTIEVEEMYWNADNIYEALKNEIDKEKLFERYWYALNKYELKETPINLVNYALGVKPYTEEERLADEAKIKEAFRLLKESINENKRTDDNNVK